MFNDRLARDIPTTLVRGKTEGWVRVRIAGQTDWKRLWMSVTSAVDGPTPSETPGSSINTAPGGVGGSPVPPVTGPKKRRMSSLFSRDPSPGPPVAAKAMITMYSSPKPKDKKKALLTMKDVTQAFAVYPERPELISRSTIIKVEGQLGDEDAAGALKSREAWLLVMPELESGLGQAAEMLKWVVGECPPPPRISRGQRSIDLIALHDAFQIYGRPAAWTWDPRDPISLMFGYPVGPHKDVCPCSF